MVIFYSLVEEMQISFNSIDVSFHISTKIHYSWKFKEGITLKSRRFQASATV